MKKSLKFLLGWVEMASGIAIIVALTGCAGPTITSPLTASTTSAVKMPASVSAWYVACSTFGTGVNLAKTAILSGQVSNPTTIKAIVKTADGIAPLCEAVPTDPAIVVQQIDAGIVAVANDIKTGA